ncbi:SMP-30/gluconolactonase/LRE family protein [Rhizobium sp. 768_B6_N1_8]|uniref:SMP-30/gluconolactonase/LRE family protein n=1 Tax=unclassified Rhizobium TaxID=2613769 RepID=UPI003F210EB5
MSATLRDLLLGKDIEMLVEAGQVKAVARNLGFGEGPAYLRETDSWIFSDIPNDRLLEYSDKQGTRVAQHPANYPNGHFPMPGGGFLSCEHLSRSVTRTDLHGRTTLICSHFEGRRLNSPNDVVVAPDGSIWFSDPTYGILSDLEGRKAPPEQEKNRVYRVGSDGRVTAEVDSLSMPNGLAFAPNGQSIYLVDSAADMGPDIGFDPSRPRDVLVFDISSHGHVTGEGRLFYSAREGIADGLRVHPDGFVWIGTGEGVVCVAVDGSVAGVLSTPTPTSNLAFGGISGERLFVTTAAAAYVTA